METHLVRIGNSKGIRIPQGVLELYHLREGSPVVLEVRRDGLLLRLGSQPNGKISWENAYREMAAEAEERSEWGEWDTLAGDGPDV